MITKTLGFTIVIAAASFATGCSASRVAPQTPTPELVGTVAPQSQTSLTGVLSVDGAIERACGLPTPRFAFDSSKVQESTDPGLNKIAECFTTGPLAGRSMRLVGHADPRGELEYNFALGQRRAGGVADYIEHRGVRSSQVSATSRGELDATGTNEDGWASDRRVDMILAN